VAPVQNIGDKPKDRELPKPMAPKEKKPEGKEAGQKGPDEGGRLDVVA
jgi:hypothetical protein